MHSTHKDANARSVDQYIVVPSVERDYYLTIRFIFTTEGDRYKSGIHQPKLFRFALRKVCFEKGGGGGGGGSVNIIKCNVNV